MNEKFVKGILLMISILATAYLDGNIIWAQTLLSMACVGIGYYVKNYFMPSDSQQGQFSLRDILSILILTIVATVGDSISGLVINGIIDWGALGKMALGVIFTYFTSTYYSGIKK